jgi:hypothetical protein
MPVTGFQPIDLSVHLGSDVAAVRDALERQGATVTPQALAVAGPLALLYLAQAGSRLLPAAYPGSVIQPVVVGSSVVGFAINEHDQVIGLQERIVKAESP